jgi:hypothetical protein
MSRLDCDRHLPLPVGNKLHLCMITPYFMSGGRSYNIDPQWLHKTFKHCCIFLVPGLSVLLPLRQPHLHQSVNDVDEI